MTVKQSSARDVAVLALRDRSGNVSAHLDRLLIQDRSEGPERSLAEELALGVIKRTSTLDAELRVFLAQPDRRLPGSLNEILQVALYQILFLDRVPDFAAVNEAVDQAGRFHHRRQGGLVNGVLRTVLRALEPAQPGPGTPAANIIPISASLHRPVTCTVFADPKSKPAEYLAEAFSLPPVLAGRWVTRFGLEQAVQIASHANCRPPMIVRVNRLKANVQTVLDQLAAAGIAARPHQNSLSVALEHPVNIAALEIFLRGLVQPQDPSATQVVMLADPQPGAAVLDFCAAPGTKTTHLAERMDNRGSIVAVDVSEDKLQRVIANCVRLGVDIVKTTLADKAAALEPASFDLVLADVPCSNTGVLARRAEARWHFDEAALATLARDQRVLAALAAGFVRPGGRLVYSTCSIEPEEGPQVAAHLGRVNPRMKLVREELTPPGGADDVTAWRDGGYVAVFQST